MIYYGDGIRSDVKNGYRIATEIADGDAKYGYRSLPSPSRSHMGDGDKMETELTHSHLVYFL